MYGTSNTSTIDLGATRADAELSLVKVHWYNKAPVALFILLLITYMQFCVILPFPRQNDPHFRVPMTCPITQDSPAKYTLLASAFKCTKGLLQQFPQ